MRPSVKTLMRATFMIGAAAGLVDCNWLSDSSAPTAGANQVTGAIEVKRSFPSCDVTVKIHNGTTYHLTDAAFGITGYHDTLSVKDIIAGGDDTAEMSIPIGYDGSSCLAIARTIEQHAADNNIGNVGTCTMEGATEGECQHLFAFHSAISEKAIQADIDRLKSGNLKIGDAAPLKSADGRVADVTTEFGNETSANCADNSTPTWAPEVQDIHRDGDGVADSYQIGGACQNGDTVHGWVARAGTGQ